MIVSPPLIYRLCYRRALWRGDSFDSQGRPLVYLTFDDGPIPEVTPRVLELLAEYGVRATFFMVGDNVRRHPQLLQQVLDAGHAVGNHTMHHLQGLRCGTRRYLRDIEQAADIIPSKLFRPPHGLMRRRQYWALLKRYKIVMQTLITCDYDAALTADDIVTNVKRHLQPGVIIVLHDSLKAHPRMLQALPRILTHIKDQGYEFALID